MAKQATMTALAVGDHVRLKARDGNQHKSFHVSKAESASFREPVDGMVLSIREVRSGKLVPATKGEFDQYIVEMIYSQTFNAKFASLRNAPRGSEDPLTTVSWRRLRAALRATIEKDELFSTAMPSLLTDSPLATLLDGWKVIKVWSTELESLEKPEGPQEAVAE